MSNIKLFKLYDLPEPEDAFVNTQAQEALAQGSVTQPIVVDNDVIRSGAYKKGISGWALNPDGSIEALNATIVGNITATTGTIGGWSIVSNTLVSGAVTLDAGNKQLLFGAATAPTVGTGIFLGLSGGVYQFRAGDPAGDYILWDGTDLTVVGNISVASIDIGGADATSMHVDIDGNMWLGAAIYNITTNPFAVSSAGLIRSVSGSIGGWTLSATSLTSTGIILDSANQKIQVGATTPITIDGVAKEIESDNYVSGVFGAGFHIDSNLLEVGNIAARGLIRTAVFQKDVISAVGGNFAVLDSDVLDENMTADDYTP
jgi:hypothetical protein